MADTNDATEVTDLAEKLAATTLDAEPTKTEETTKGNDDNKSEETSEAVDAAQLAAEAVANKTKTDETSTASGTTEQKDEQSDEDKTNLIINYLPPTMSEGTLATLFSPYGLLERCKIVVDLQTLRSRGYGFVKYDNKLSAERAMKALNGYELNGKRLKVAYARQQCKAITNANLYITNIPVHFEDENLYKLFQDYGKIIECRVLKDQNGQSRGVGFVRMDTHHNAIQALQAMDQYVIDEKHPPLLVKLAQRRVPRRYWNNQNRGVGGGAIGNNRGRGNRGGRGRGRNNKGRYQQKQNRQQQYGQQMPQMAGMGGQMGMGDMGGNMMGNMGGKRGNSSHRGGYYRPRQQQYKQNQQKAQYQQRRQPNQGGQPYFPTAMYDAPYGIAPQYPQAAYAQNMHMAPAMNQPQNPANPSGVGAYFPEMAALSAATYQTQ